MFNGSLITEILFDYPGLDLLIYQAVLQGDFNLLMGTISLSVIAVATATMVIDLIYRSSTRASGTADGSGSRTRPSASTLGCCWWCSSLCSAASSRGCRRATRWPGTPRRATSRRAGPTSLGTTSLGQDIFWLLALALRNSLILGVSVGFLATVIGVFLGLAAGYTGGWLDRVISFFMDALLCIPTLPILILMAALFGGQLSLPVIGVALLVFNWPYPGRQVRAVALTMREREFVNVAWFSGEAPVRILIRHIFPYIAGWSMANFINTILVVIATESALAVIGLRAPSRRRSAR